MNFFDRVQQLHALLRDRRSPISGQQLQDELECSRATLHRLIAKLRDELGAPIIYVREPPGYRYRSDANFELPGLWFTPHELVALLTIERVLAETGPGWLGEQLSPLRDKVRNLLADETAGLPDWSDRLRLLSQAARPAGPSFATVASALARRKRLKVRYRARSRQDARSERELSPQRLTRYRDNWYLDAWCHWREGLRSFSLDRIDVAELIDTPAVTAFLPGRRGRWPSWSSPQRPRAGCRPSNGIPINPSSGCRAGVTACGCRTRAPRNWSPT